MTNKKPDPEEILTEVFNIIREHAKRAAEVKRKEDILKKEELRQKRLEDSHAPEDWLDKMCSAVDYTKEELKERKLQEKIASLTQPLLEKLKKWIKNLRLKGKNDK